MMKGAIDFLTDETNEEAEMLRQAFVFKIVPMLNPDGVINGNYRCSLAGCDLNRRWKAPSRYLHSTVYYTKQMIQNFAKERELVIFCDFHGHSRKKNVFMYGCIANPNDKDASQLNQVIQCVPESVCQTCSIFNFKDCKFACEKEKETTARIVLFRELGILNSYTLECTFYGSDLFKNPERRLKNLHSNL
mmetsp:Transcript_43510/g.41984  ORF Transcript_43510/g.41984 Transcript_43510/m.41984 type:complete len:190 (-) Transcript_43510:2307-2876(-)